MLRKWFMIPMMGSLAVLAVAEAAQAQTLRDRMAASREMRIERRNERFGRGIVVRNRVSTEAQPTMMGTDTGSGRVSYYNTPANQGPANAAQIRVMLPTPEAKVMFDGAPTTQVGTDRLYYTPALTVGANNTYKIRITYLQGTQEMTQERTLNVAPNMTYVVNFSAPTETIRRPR